MSDLCKWLHEELEKLPLVRYPFNPADLPLNGVYFFYEDGEQWCHGDSQPRIVRVGTHRDGNFRSRIAEHFCLDDRKMDFTASKSAPKDRSIFRKQIGRALLNRADDPYLSVWNLDFLTAVNRARFAASRNIPREKDVEIEITALLRSRFAFRFIPVPQQADRLGTGGLEAKAIATLAQCHVCSASSQWLGRSSPIEKIRNGVLWQEQHIRGATLKADDILTLQKRLHASAKT